MRITVTHRLDDTYIELLRAQQTTSMIGEKWRL